VDLDAMIADYAQAAVDTARAMNVALDYSEQSLEQVEQVLARLHDELRDMRIAQAASAAVSTEAAPAAPSDNQISEMCRLWGSYFGEVVRRRWGGEWSVETYPGGNFATLALTVTAGKLFPSMKVYRRLTEGDGDNLWRFYQTVRARLAAAPGGAVQ
jgi:acyl-CoA reductase-like NAD-dependent aldehyde dehydrogenase